MTVTEAAFWAKVRKTESCWFWTGGGGRYGQLRVAGVATPAHQFAWELVNGPVPEGLELMHTCDVTRCVRPDHVVAGTHAENMADAARKGRMKRGPRGEPLTPFARWLVETNTSMAALAQRIGVNTSVISRTAAGKSVPEGRVCLGIIEASAGVLSLKELVYPYGRAV